jgi:aldose 1-epimerase
MLRSIIPAVVALSACVVSATSDIIGPDKNGKYTIEAEGIKALFIPYGASISNLFIKDIHGVQRDIVLGYDNASYYTIDPAHPHYGGVPGKFSDTNSELNLANM